MLVVMRGDATAQQIGAVCDAITAMGFEPVPMPGAQRTAIGLIGNEGPVDGSAVSAMEGVAQVIYVSKAFKQVSREWRPENTVVTIAPGVAFGGTTVACIIAGPCSVESEQQILAAARGVRAAGAVALRGGAFKPRSSPYSFQGLGKKGLELLALAGRETGLAVVSEAMDEAGAELVAEHCHCIPDWRAQYAELFVAQGRRAHRQTGAAQARPRRHDYRIPAERRVHSCRRQHTGDSV